MRTAKRRKKTQLSMYIDDYSVQVVALNGDDILYYGEELLEEGTVLNGDIINISALGDAMGKAVSHAKAKTRNVRVSWSPARTLYKLIPMPTNAGKNVRSALMIDAEQQLQPIDPSLLHIHVFQRPEDINMAAVIAYDKKQVGRLIEAALIGRVKIEGLYHPTFGLVSVNDHSRALCYLGTRSVYYAEGDQTPHSIGVIRTNHMVPAFNALLAHGIGSDTDWIDDFAQGVLLTRSQNQKQTGIETDQIAFAGPLLAVRGLARYLAGILTSVKLTTVRMPFTWPEGTTKEIKAHYHVAAAAFAALADTNIITSNVSFAKKKEESVVAGGVRVIEDESSNKWLLGLAGTAILILALSLGGKIGIEQLADRANQQATDYNQQTMEISTRGEARVLGSQDWIEKEKEMHDIWDANTPIRDNLVNVTDLKALFEEAGLRVDAVNIAAESITVEYTGDDKLLDTALADSMWTIVDSSRGVVEIKVRTEKESTVEELDQEADDELILEARSEADNPTPGGNV